MDYKEKRFLQYPATEDQLDNIWHDINQGKLDKNGKFYKAIKEVKDKYPKPE